MHRSPPALVGISAGIRSVEDEVVQTRRATSSVLLTGEDGVGKSLVARLIHDRSPRAAGPFIAASCDRLSEEVLECRLFGPEYGAARAAYDGDGSWLEAAHGGTLFLDDIDEIGLRAQETLLRFLDSGQHQCVPPGRRPDRRRPPLDVRLIAATRRALLGAVRLERFLEHLYYRLNVVHIEIPALRARREDAPVLMHHFLRTFADSHDRAVPALTPDALALLMGHRWRGNVAELKRVAEWLVLHGEAEIDAQAVRAAIKAVGAPARDAPAAGRAGSVHEEMLARILQGSETFWSGVYEPFMRRDLTRTDVRSIVLLGLEGSGGTFKALAERLKVRPRDYRRLEAFLRKCQCEMQTARAPLASARHVPRTPRSRRATA
jgi:two-component system response regulator HydG